MFGIDCPGCGFQRSILFVMKGDFIEAFHSYPAIFTIILLFLVLIISSVFKWKKRRKVLLSLVYVNTIVIMVSYCIKMSYLLYI